MRERGAIAALSATLNCQRTTREGKTANDLFIIPASPVNVFQRGGALAASHRLLMRIRICLPASQREDAHG